MFEDYEVPNQIIRILKKPNFVCLTVFEQHGFILVFASAVVVRQNIALGLRCLKWQADVAACGPIRCLDEYGQAGIGVPMVRILPTLAAVFSSSHSAGSVV